MSRGFCSFRKHDKFSGGLDWWAKGLTFWAPFDRVADPLKLNRGVGALSFTRATDASFLNPDTGLIEMVGSGNLRIEADGALIEGARTNNIHHSSAFAWWAKESGASITDDQITDPTGALHGALVTVTPTNGIYPSGPIHVGAGAVFTESIYMRSVSGSGTVMLYEGWIAGVAPTECSLTPEWKRFYLSATAAEDGLVGHYIKAGTLTEAYIACAQVELGAFPSSYIPTTTAAVTRDADALTFPAISGAGTGIAKIDDVYQEIDYDTFAPTSGHVADVRKWNRTLSAPELALLGI